MNNQKRVTQCILDQVSSYPSFLAGVCSVEPLMTSISYQIYSPVTWQKKSTKKTHVTASIPPNARSVLVLALVHPPEYPQLDWWDGRGTEGNRKLIRISSDLKGWLSKNLSITAHSVPYHPEKGGVFLKEAAVLAGLGIIGRNNLLINPKFGPYVRLRAMFLETELFPTGPLTEFSPCEQCSAPCQEICPQKSFGVGHYERDKCVVQMEMDRVRATDPEKGQLTDRVRYCRACERACPVGQKV